MVQEQQTEVEEAGVEGDGWGCPAQHAQHTMLSTPCPAHHAQPSQLTGFGPHLQDAGVLAHGGAANAGMALDVQVVAQGAHDLGNGREGDEARRDGMSVQHEQSAQQPEGPNRREGGLRPVA